MEKVDRARSSMNYRFRQGSSFGMTSTTFLPNTSQSSSSSQLTVEFDFLFTSEKIVIRRVRHPQAESVTRAPLYPNRRASASVPAASSSEDMARAVAGAIGDYPLLESDRRGLVNLALGEASRRLTTPPQHGGVLHLGFEIGSTHLHVHQVRSLSGAPAAESLEEVEVREGCLEEYEVREGEEEEKRCCICLEELTGGGASRMPCLHVFHGGCIRKWLRKSRCCPICRYELPTSTSTSSR